MAWEYSQSTGQLRHNGRAVGVGYAGNGAGKNNPRMEMMPEVGPIPRGRYQISRPYDTEGHGPHVMKLDPLGHTAHGRTAFLIHGDNRRSPGHASKGCIILSRYVREQISASGDPFLDVTE
jgi:hypothetical protein